MCFRDPRETKQDILNLVFLVYKMTLDAEYYIGIRGGPNIYNQINF